MSKLLVALSGGVDSAVAASLLQEQGHELVGATMRLWPRSRCCDEKDIEDAADLCVRLGIPYHVLDYREAFRQEVVDPFIADYHAGRTPNPCARCNQILKFDALWREAKALGAEGLATGHYVRVEQGSKGPILRRGADPRKDQSYFLFAIGRDILPRLHFPVGHLDKTQVRALARERDLPVAGKGDSQDICFVPDGDYRRFLHDQGALKVPQEGEIVDTQGQVLGHHPGIVHFTVGQRRGLGSGGAEPRYVLGLDAEKQQVRVGTATELLGDGVSLRDCRWLVDWPTPGPHQVEVKLRYGASPVAAQLDILPDGRAHVQLSIPQRAITPGQAAVCYQEDQLLGGGWIL